MSIFVCGSLAFDTTMMLDNKLRINDDTPLIEANFSVPDLRRDFGGGAGNIVYTLNKLNIKSLPIATVGIDFNSYHTWLKKQGIIQDYIKVIDHSYTAHTYVTIDIDDTRITAFHPGAMNFSSLNRMNLRDESVSIGVVASDNIDGMRIHANQFTEANIPFLYYPSHSMNKMQEDDWLHLIEQSAWTVLNDEQCQLMEKKLGLSAEQLSFQVRALIISPGTEGARIYHEGLCHYIPTIKPLVNYDISGADDAFCAGILYGIKHDIDWDTTGRLASLIKAIKIEHHGTQKHTIDLKQLKQRFQEVFHYEFLTSTL